MLKPTTREMKPMEAPRQEKMMSPEPRVMRRGGRLPGGAGPSDLGDEEEEPESGFKIG